MSRLIKLLIFGGTGRNALHQEQQVSFAESIQKILGGETPVTIVTTTDGYIRYELHRAVQGYADSIRESVDSYITHHLPVTETTPSPIQGGAEELHIPIDRNWEENHIIKVLSAEKPDIALCIGGCDNYAWKTFEQCMKSQIPVIGMPLFEEETGKRIYNWTMKGIQQTPPSCFIKTVEKYGDNFIHTMKQMGTADCFKVLPQLFRVCLTELEL